MPFLKTPIILIMLGLVSSLPQPDPNINVNIKVNVNMKGGDNAGLNNTGPSEIWCPTAEGFFMPEGTDLCFKIFIDAFSWTQAKAKCQSEEPQLQMAETRSEVDAVNTGKYLKEKYVNYIIWLGAQGTGPYFVWNRDEEQISNNDPLWMAGQPFGTTELPGGTSDNYCLEAHNDINDGTDAVWVAKKCTDTSVALCELVKP